MVGVSLRGAHLENANLEAANLEGAILCEAAMPHVNLQSALLTNADFRGANLDQGNLRHAHLMGALFGNAQAGEAITSRRHDIDAFIQQHPMNDRRSAMQAQILTFIQAALQEGQSLTVMRIEHAVGISYASLRRHLEDLQTQGYIQWNGKYIQLPDHAGLPAANLAGADLSHAHLERAQFREAHLEHAIFQEGFLAGAIFFQAYLDSADFSAVKIG
jgi:uncharacterized protein YjbI with pentapeptide repeats